MKNEFIGEIRRQFDRVLAEGCSWADIRVYTEDATESLYMDDGNLEGNSASLSSGIGVRVLYRGAWGFAATAKMEKMAECFSRAVNNARAAAELPGFPKDSGEVVKVAGKYESPVMVDPFTVKLREKTDFMRAIDANLQKSHVEHRNLSLYFQKRIVHYFNTDGTEYQRKIINNFADMVVMAADDEGRTQQRSCELAGNGNGTRGFEWLADSDFAGNADRITAELAELLAAPKLPAGKRSLILLPGQGFLQVHETIGHALELDRILGYELSFAGGSHVKPDMIGNLSFGSEKLNAYAGFTPNSPGTFGLDDDGIPQSEYPLIKNGLLVNVLSCRGDIKEANHIAGREVMTKSGGASRSCAFYRPPIDRMTNINVAPGNDGTLDDIIAATENGVVLDVPVSWSIGSNREHFHFGCEIAWEVKDGVRGKVYKNSTYHGHSLPFWHNLDKVGDITTWKLQQVANCGKGEPNQIMEVGHGIPVMRFADVDTGEE